MLQITIPAVELFDENTNEFISTKEQTLQLEHSLVSLHKWESKWCKPFLSKQDKSPEELLDYVKCMTVTQNVDPDVYMFLTDDNLRQINSYIEAPMTATTFSDNGNSKKNREIVTAELIYCWMITLNIPFECKKWHLNSLLTLIKVCTIKNQPPKKTSKKDLLSRNAALNAARRKQYNTSG
jgi:hypothetical protein